MSNSGGDLDNSQRIEGATNGTMIGNVGDSLKVSATLGVGPQSISSKLRAVFSATNQNITGASYVSFYTYSGSGYFWAFRVNLDNDGGQIQLSIDGDIIFNNITSKNISDLGAANSFLPWHSRTSAGTYYFYAPIPIAFSSNVTLSAKRDNNGALTVQQRIIYISQET
jgi:hypothetical protein